METGPRTKTAPSPALEPEPESAEFLEDIRVSLQEMQAGQVLPAEEALRLIELGLDDDELDSRLPE